MLAQLLILCFGNFVIGTGTMIVSGTLADIAAELGTSVAQTGQLITAFAIACCIGAPVFAALASRIDRRRLLVISLAIFCAGHLASAACSSLVPLWLARFFTAFGAAIYTPQAAATVALLVPPARRSGAVGFVFLGWSIAAVVGMPLGHLIGAAFGWRAAMLVVAVMSMATALLLHWGLPGGLYTAPIGAATWRAVFGRRALMTTVAVTVLQGSGMFTLFAYITPYYRDVLHASTGTAGLLFFTYGVAGVLGNMLAGRYLDRIGPARVVLIALASNCLAQLVWPLGASQGAVFGATASVVFLWGLGGFAVNGAQQARLLWLAGPLAPAAVSLNSSAIYIGQAIGATAGGLLYEGLGPTVLSWGALAFTLAAVAMSVAAERAQRAEPAT